VSQAVLYARLVKVEHTVFALPFAYVGAFLAEHEVPPAHDLFWITVAMVGARSLAMALNRLIDAGIDARNPRTAGRELPAGALTVPAVVVFCAASLLLFLVAVWQLQPIVRWLWPIPVTAFVVYPYLKRFTWLCHLWLGAVDGLAPIGGWVAVKGNLPWQAWALGGAVAAWVAGFDLFYSLFDVAVDRAQGLHSWATRFGERSAFTGARALHIGAVGLLVRRNVLVMFMCVELMLNAVNLTFVTFARMLDDIGGQVIVFFVLVVAAAEVVVGLGIIVAIFRRRAGATADDISLLKG